MAADDKMSLNERRKYLRQMQKRYRKASRQEKSQLLDEMQAVTGQHRKHLTRLMNGNLERQPRRRERGKTYGHEVAAAVAGIAESLDWVCAERLQPNLGWLADHLVRHGELRLTPAVRAKLDTASISTVRRLLAEQPHERPRLPRQGPTQANHLRRDIPTRRIPWHEAAPGHFEVDLVHHCGPSSSGHYVHTFQMIDVATGWSERAATLGRSFLVMQDAFRRILARLPFPIREIHPDNGSEFLNDHLVRFWRAAVTDVQLSRSRPYHKNDNRIVEQKNFTLVRAYLGHDRLDTVAQTSLLNQLYDRMWLYYNFFQPAMRLTEKRASPANHGHPARFIRRFDEAQTPFDRVCQTEALSAAQQFQLRALRDETNPCQLRRDIYRLLDQLFALPNAAPDDGSQDVYQTLFAPHLVTKGEARPVTLSIE
jgi:hypothetical protein